MTQDDFFTNAADPAMTFDSFIAGDGNDIAHAAAASVARDNPARYHPVYIHGAAGCGKTHLLHAIAGAIAAAGDGRRALLMTAEEFTARFIAASRFNHMPRFDEAIAAADVLLIDNIHFICGKEATGAELRGIFNRMHGTGKTLVVAANAPSRALEGICPHLQSRLGWGMEAEIKPASAAIAARLIRNRFGDGVDDDAVALLTALARRNLGALGGLLNRIALAMETGGITGGITAAIADELLGEAIPPRPMVSVGDIKKRVATEFGITVDEMEAHRRARRLARPRQVVMYLAHELTAHSYPAIGRALGRDHTTVMYGIRKIEAIIREDEELLVQVRRIRADLEVA